MTEADEIAATLASHVMSRIHGAQVGGAPYPFNPPRRQDIERAVADLAPGMGQVMTDNVAGAVLRILIERSPTP